MITVREKNFGTISKRKAFEAEDGDGTIFQNENLNKISVKNNSNVFFDNQDLDKKPSILTMKDEWTTYSSIGVQRKILKQNTKKIKNYINSLAVPSWYRGVSLFQKKSAELLLHAIRDDCAQRTVYRTMRCLDSIGLDPLPTKKQLHTILTLCGGSDLALLWFLKEWLYRDNESDSYSVNEQLIISSIAHLDMNTTLRELDRILPPGHAPKTDIFQRTRRNLQKRKNNNVKSNTKNILPYFEKLERPIPSKSTYLGREPIRKANLDFYNDSSRVRTNESHRWFQAYNINGNETTVDNFAKEKISELLNNFEVNMFDENKVQTVYGQHEDINNLKNTFDYQLNEIANRKVQEMGQIFDRKDQSYKRIIRRLQRDVEKHRREFHTMVENCHKHCDLKLTSNTVRGKKVNNMDSTLYSSENQGYRDQQNIRSTCSATTMAYGRYSPQKCPVMEFHDKYDFSSKTSENDSESKYFCISQDHFPFKFDYSKLFEQKRNQSEFINFEDSDITFLNQFGKYSSSDGLDNKASNCIHEIWEQQLRQHEVIEFNCNAKASIKPSIVDYGLDYYDPEDDELMDCMLKKALDIMKRDHKFVFASMPAAHRYPMLREWIRLRYGKKFKKDEMIRSFQQSQPIFSALAKVGLPVEMPSNADMGTDLITDYSCRDYVLRKSNYIRNEYYRRIDKAILAQSRVIYFAMCPFLCCNGSPSNTIFAYMPAHKRKNYHFRPWKPEECMKRKQVNNFQTWMSHSQSANKLKSAKNRQKI